MKDPDDILDNEFYEEYRKGVAAGTFDPLMVAQMYYALSSANYGRQRCREEVQHLEEQLNSAKTKIENLEWRRRDLDDDIVPF